MPPLLTTFVLGPGVRPLIVASLCVATAVLVCLFGSAWLNPASMLLVCLLSVPSAALFGGVRAGVVAAGLTAVPLLLLLPEATSLPWPMTLVLLAIMGALLVVGRSAADRTAAGNVDEGQDRVRQAAATLVWSERAQSTPDTGQRRKADFLALLSHELRNPLSAIQSALAVMRSRRDIHTGQHARAVIERQIAHIARLIDDLMDTARIERGSLSLQCVTIDLRDALRTAIEAAEPFMTERRQVFVVRLAAEPLWVSGDRVRLQQVFSNLLLNAAKYTPSGGQITLEASRALSDICVVIRDTGRGIAADRLDHLFEPFVRDARDVQGLGMGLYVARTLIEQHKGSITADSPGPDRGTTFTVCLPELSPLLRRAV